jgi:hypothetical protein
MRHAPLATCVLATLAGCSLLVDTAGLDDGAPLVGDAGNDGGPASQSESGGPDASDGSVGLDASDAWDGSVCDDPMDPSFPCDDFDSVPLADPSRWSAIQIDPGAELVLTTAGSTSPPNALSIRTTPTAPRARLMKTSTSATSGFECRFSMRFESVPLGAVACSLFAVDVYPPPGSVMSSAGFALFGFESKMSLGRAIHDLDGGFIEESYPQIANLVSQKWIEIVLRVTLGSGGLTSITVDGTLAYSAAMPTEDVAEQTTWRVESTSAEGCGDRHVLYDSIVCRPP